MKSKLSLPFGHTRPVEIQDLGLTIRLGQEIIIDSDKARNSVCIAALLQSRRLVLLPLEKEHKMTQPKPTIHTVALSRPARILVSQVPQTPTAHAGASAEEIAAIVAKTVEAVLSKREVQTAPAAAPQINVEGIVERALEAALSKIPLYQGAGATPRASSEHDEPLYIPSGIVTEKSVEIKTTSGSSDANELEQSLKALKSIPRQKRVKKEVPDEE